jgi:hypothetical protein
MKDYNWIWQEMPRRLGLTGDSFRSTLNASGLSPAELFARECIQNAADAAQLARQDGIAPKDSGLRLEFEFKTLTDSEKKKFVNVLKADQLSTRIEHLDVGDRCFLRAVHSDKPLKLLIVRDRNTTGLYGDPFAADMQSHLARLLFSLGDRAKTRELSNAGGAYGFGKGALSRVSRAYIVIAYSRFDEKADNGVHSRLLGCGYYPFHNIGGVGYSGLADFGMPNPSDESELFTAVENVDAETLATELHIGARKTGDTGTSILIPDPDINPEELVEAIEKWWFPAIISSLYEISVISDNERLFIRPGSRTKRPDLYPFIKAYRIAEGIDEPTGASEKLFNFERLEGRKAGSLGMVLNDDPTSSSEGPDFPRTEVALVRSNRMVVQFMHITDAQPAAKGTFVAHDDVDKILKLS